MVRSIVKKKNENPTKTHRCILEELPCDTEAMITTFRWVDFLLHRVKRERLAQLMTYYEEIGWIGSGAKSQVISIARGTIQDVASYESEENAFTEPDQEMNNGLDYQRVNDYRLTATDHVKTLMFIMKIVGEPQDELDVNRWETDPHTVMGI